MRGGLATIVVPAHNVATYISDCMASILSQTYENIEVLVVDDGSSDDTARVVEGFASVDSRVQLFCNLNHGVSYSRNFAIARGTGEYLLFVDADDVVAPDYVESIVEPLSRADCECSAVGIALFVDETPKFGVGCKQLYLGDDIFLACLDKCRGFLWNKGFLYSIVRDNQIEFDEKISQSEDMMFLLDYLTYCNALSFDSGIRYGYRQRHDSAANNQLNSRWFDAIKVYEAYEARLGDKPALVEAVRKSYLPIAYEARWRYRHCRLNDRELLSKIDSMRTICEQGLSERSIKYRLKMFVYRHFMGVEMKRRRTVAQ